MFVDVFGNKLCSKNALNPQVCFNIYLGYELNTNTTYRYTQIVLYMMYTSCMLY